MVDERSNAHPAADAPERIALFGGVYNNTQALEAVLSDVVAQGAEEVWFLGDAGGFGPHPERAIDVLRTWRHPGTGEPLRGIAGNYDSSIASGKEDCGCGYTDPEDKHFAQVSYDYTLARTGPEARRWLGQLPGHARTAVGSRTVALAHGSPARVNEFLWESGTSDAYLTHLLDRVGTDVLCVTHTGLHWHRRLPDGRLVVNVGAIGRPANDGRRGAWFAILEGAQGGHVDVEHVHVGYDWRALAQEMREEGLPEPFVETVETGWWTTCLENMPARERARGHH